MTDSHFVRNSSLLQNTVCGISGVDSRGNRKRLSRHRALPNFMATFSLPDEHTVVLTQQRDQLGVIARTHELHRNQMLVVALVKVEVKSDLCRWNGKTVLQSHFWRYLPDPSSYRVKRGGFCDEAKVITDSNKHPGFWVKSDANSEGNWELDYVCHSVNSTHKSDVAHSGKRVYMRVNMERPVK